MKKKRDVPVLENVQLSAVKVIHILTKELLYLIVPKKNENIFEGQRYIDIARCPLHSLGFDLKSI